MSEVDATEGDVKHILYANLQDRKCDLWHEEERQSIDYIFQKCTFGDVVIAICEECIKRLQDDDWILLFCINCSSSIWIYKPEAKKPWLYKKGEHIIWMPGCLYCSRVE